LLFCRIWRSEVWQFLNLHYIENQTSLYTRYSIDYTRCCSPVCVCVRWRSHFIWKRRGCGKRVANCNTFAGRCILYNTKLLPLAALSNGWKRADTQYIYNTNCLQFYCILSIDMGTVNRPLNAKLLSVT
jgi:hypothetical protein